MAYNELCIWCVHVVCARVLCVAKSVSAYRCIHVYTHYKYIEDHAHIRQETSNRVQWLTYFGTIT